jgi:hypothetical protein
MNGLIGWLARRTWAEIATAALVAVTAAWNAHHRLIRAWAPFKDLDTPPQQPPDPPTPPVAPRVPLPRPPPPAGDGWTGDIRRLQQACGCVHIIDHLARTRTRYPCPEHFFDVDHWERRLQQ